MTFDVPPAVWSQFVAFIGGGVLLGFVVMLFGFALGTFGRTVLHTSK